MSDPLPTSDTEGEQRSPSFSHLGRFFKSNKFVTGAENTGTKLDDIKLLQKSTVKSDRFGKRLLAPFGQFDRLPFGIKVAATSLMFMVITFVVLYFVAKAKNW
ncbi:unnamed protein product [Hyaloperonospora brassicae]|uniref:Uncharacterized protein n=1 Tax=Hyaloperonospora brassicae TaxID=162125 RepID=A0AAV0T5V2_HYABA|nr:unnamed protein product [Hyaloperonospora brassicae]